MEKDFKKLAEELNAILRRYENIDPCISFEVKDEQNGLWSVKSETNYTGSIYGSELEDIVFFCRLHNLSFNVSCFDLNKGCGVHIY